MTTDSYGGGKGLELIPFEKIEVIFNGLPILFTIMQPSATDSAMLRSWSSTASF
jgi:hypothetical protein